MESSSNKTTLELFELGPCEEPYRMGYLIGQRFADLIKSRVASDLILQQQLLPFAHSLEAQPLMQALTSSNKLKFPEYWDELLGTAKGSDVPFLPKPAAAPPVTDNDCSDVLVVSDSLAIAVKKYHDVFSRTQLPGASGPDEWSIVHRLHIRRRAPELCFRLQPLKRFWQVASDGTSCHELC